MAPSILALDKGPKTTEESAEIPPAGREESPGEERLEEADGTPGCADCAGYESGHAEDALGQAVEFFAWGGEEELVARDGENGEYQCEEFR